MALDRSQQNWPADDSHDVHICACGAPCDTSGVCSEPECVTQCFGQPISVYTRGEAIADDVLIDMETDGFARARLGLGIAFPIAMTAAAFTAAVDVAPPAKFHENQDAFSRYWDLCFALRMAIQRAKIAGTANGPELTFAVVVSWRDGSGPRELLLKSVLGGDDDGGPCMTIMLPGED